MIALDDNTHDRIKRLCEQGDRLVERGDYTAAVDMYQNALTLLPEPVTLWEAATWILAALGDAYFLSQQLKDAYDAFSIATHCPGGLGNPFIHLRLGQIQFQLGNEILAVDELARAYMGGGKEIFEGQDPKYFSLVKQHLKEPPSGW